MPTLHLEIEGRVQGVGFRWYARQCAVRKGLVGWVMNRPDGCVEVAAKGGEVELNRLRAELQTGPPGAQVTAIRDLSQISDDDLGESFRVRK